MGSVEVQSASPWLIGAISELLQEFESTLKEVVQAKRLSASKMTKLSDIALKSMKDDTQLVSILYRTHKTLPPKAKISSFYAFDALSRAARNQVNKLGLTGDANSEKGNCATFLLKVEGVLDGLFQDMISSGNGEAKEKTKKVLDIWVKSNTFPPAVLARLGDIMKEAEKEPKLIPNTTPDPRSQSTPTPPSASIPPGVNPVQSTLLALLSQAASAAVNNSQTTPNIAGATLAQLDANQLALIQQLAQTTQLGPANNAQPVTLPLPLVSSASTHVPFAQPYAGHETPSYDERYNYDRREKPHLYNGPGRSRSGDDYHDDRRDARSSYRGGHRGQGRGRFEDRNHFRERDRNWSPPPRGGRSRSRSPPSRHGGNAQRYSPPRRPPQKHDLQNADPARSGVLSGDRDEFGRDVRTQPSRDVGTASTIHDKIDMRSPPALTSVASSLEPSPTLGDNRASQSRPPIYAKDGGSSKVVSSEKGLDTYDFTAFDLTSPAAWEALGKAWQVTHGYVPSTEELMQLVMSRTIPSAVALGSQPEMLEGEPWSGPSWHSSQINSGSTEAWDTSAGAQWSSGGGATGGYERGNARGQEEPNHGGQDYEQARDNVKLKETSERSPLHAATEGRTTGASSGGGTGRMQKVGDKWIFVKSGTS